MNPADVVQAIEACQQELQALDGRAFGIAADVRRVLPLLELLAAALKVPPEKQLYRVLEAVREGYDTSASIAAYLHIEPRRASDELSTL